MAEFIVMPKLGFDMREAVLVSWLKNEGDAVEKGQVIAEIESDKATLELEAQAGGTLLKFLANEGDIVPVGDNLAIVGEQGEDISSMATTPDAEAKAKGEEKDDALQPSPDEKTTREPEADKKASVSEEYPEGVKASPVARRVAAEHAVDLTKISGSGPDGRIRKADVEAFVERKEAKPQISDEQAAVPAGPESEEISTSRLRQAIGRRMLESKTTVPHFYVTTTIDMGPVLALRKEINALIPEDEKVTVNDLIIKAAALTLRHFPNINASYGGEKLIRHNRVNVGTAVAVEGGLLTVVQKNTDASKLTRIAVDNKEMIARARNGKSRPDDFEGATFTVSNLGAYDVDHFVAIINPPNAAILAVGTAMQVPVVVEGDLAIGWRMKATLSADHRVTDGAEAAQFVQMFKEIMEHPLQMLL